MSRQKERGKAPLKRGRGAPSTSIQETPSTKRKRELFESLPEMEVCLEAGEDPISDLADKANSKFPRLSLPRKRLFEGDSSDRKKTKLDPNAQEFLFEIGEDLGGQDPFKYTLKQSTAMFKMYHHISVLIDPDHPKAIHNKIQEIGEFPQPACPTGTLREKLRLIAEEWGMGISQQMLQHYFSNIFQIRENLTLLKMDEDEFGTALAMAFRRTKQRLGKKLRKEARIGMEKIIQTILGFRMIFSMHPPSEELLAQIKTDRMNYPTVPLPTEKEAGPSWNTFQEPKFDLAPLPEPEVSPGTPKPRTPHPRPEVSPGLHYSPRPGTSRHSPPGTSPETQSPRPEVRPGRRDPPRSSQGNYSPPGISPLPRGMPNIGDLEISDPLESEGGDSLGRDSTGGASFTLDVSSISKPGAPPYIIPQLRKSTPKGPTGLSRQSQQMKTPPGAPNEISGPSVDKTQTPKMTPKQGTSSKTSTEAPKEKSRLMKTHTPRLNPQGSKPSPPVTRSRSQNMHRARPYYHKAQNWEAKMTDWQIQIQNDPHTLVLGTSNLNRITTQPSRNIEIHSYPGGRFSHMSNMLSKFKPEARPQNVIIAMGINDSNSKEYLASIKQEISKTAALAKERFPASNVFLAEVNYSHMADSRLKARTEQINSCIREQKIKVLSSLPANKVYLDPRDKHGVHWTPATANSILAHWISSLN